MSFSNTTDRASVVVVDDHGIVREGLTVLLERSPRLKVTGTAASGKQAIAVAHRLKPDVIVMDLMLPELSGIDATEHIVNELPATRVVILSVCHSSEHIACALRAGAMGFVQKRSSITEIVQAVLAVLDGKRYLSPDIVASLGNAQIDSARSPLESLSAREREVLHLTVAGATSVVIARRLCLSPKTVETYRSRIMDKLGVPDHTALIHFAMEHALTPVEGSFARA